jgi:hypothetical protein
MGIIVIINIYHIILLVIIQEERKLFLHKLHHIQAHINNLVGFSNDAPSSFDHILTCLLHCRFNLRVNRINHFKLTLYFLVLFGEQQICFANLPVHDFLSSLSLLLTKIIFLSFLCSTIAMILEIRFMRRPSLPVAEGPWLRVLLMTPLERRGSSMKTWW